MNDNKIKCMYFDHRFTEKPQGKQCGWVQKSLTQTDITIENLADALCHGASFKPGVLVGGNKAENWYQQQLFGLDFDDGIRIEDAYNGFSTLLNRIISHKPHNRGFFYVKFLKKICCICCTLLYFMI